MDDVTGSLDNLDKSWGDMHAYLRYVAIASPPVQSFSVRVADACLLGWCIYTNSEAVGIETVGMHVN